MNNKEKGAKGEKTAVKYLEEQGYEIAERNYTRKSGEIDIIAKKGVTTVFIEVKLRKNTNFGYPREAVGYKKQQVIKKLAALYLNENKLHNADCRFDVIEIIDGEQASVEHIENAFW